MASQDDESRAQRESERRACDEWLRSYQAQLTEKVDAQMRRTLSPSDYEAYKLQQGDRELVQLPVK